MTSARELIGVSTEGDVAEPGLMNHCMETTGLLMSLDLILIDVRGRPRRHYIGELGDGSLSPGRRDGLRSS